MDRETKLDMIELARAYVGIGFFSWWGFWSNIVYNQPFTNLFEFIITGGGII